MFPTIKGSYNHSAFAMRQRHLLGLADLLGTPNGDDDLAGLKYRRWPDQGNGVDFFGTALPIGQLSAWRRVSPSSLRRSPHSKAIWHLKALTFDPHTHELLLDTCPECGTRLDFIKSVGVCNCHHCEVDFRHERFDQPNVDCEDLDALDFATGLVDPENSAGKTAVASLHPAIRAENPGQIFILCLLIAWIFERSQTTPGRRVIAQASITAKNLAVASRAVMTWPEGLIDILAKSGGFRSSNVESDTRSFADVCRRSGVLNGSLTNAVQQVVMMARIGVKQPSSLRRLEVASNDLKDEALEIARFSAVSTSRACHEAIRLTKIPAITLYNCYLSGLCGPTASSLTDIGLRIREWASALSFATARRTAKLSRAISLRRCVASLYLNEGDVWPTVIRAVRDGRLPVKVALNSPGLLEDLYVDDPDVWTDFLRDTQGIAATNRFPLASTEVAFYLDISTRTAQGLFDFKKKVRFSDLQEFRNENILLNHLCCIAATR